MKKQNKKQTTTKPAELTQEETQLLKNAFWLPGWKFSEIIQPRCALIDEFWIGTTKDEEGNNEVTKVQLYGLESMDKDTKQHNIACFFLRVGCQIYQRSGISEIIELVELLKKEFVFNEWQEAQQEKIYARETGK